MPTLPEILKSKIGKGSKSKAYVASELGISEKTVENYMNGKREPKPARLIRLAELLDFKLSDLSDRPEKRENVEQNVPRATLRTSPGYIPATEVIDILKEQNEFLRRNFEISLNSIAEGQQQAGVQLKALTWYSALVANSGDPKQAEKAMQEINNKMAWYAGVGGESSNQTEEGSPRNTKARK